jgi:hypothetical protein
MSIIVPDEILNATTKCPHSFSCLESGMCGEHKMCEASNAIEPNLLELKSKIHETCAYRITFGYYQFCSCPTHFTIFRMQEL